MKIDDILKIVMLVSAVLMMVSILLQQRGASLGAGFGGSSELYTTRRGFDKNLFDVTVIFAVLFVGSIIVGLLIG